MRALALALLLSACLAQPVDKSALMTWDDHEALPERSPDRTIAYGADPLQVIDLWLPKGKGPHPAVIMLHGGCWKSDIADRTIMNPVAHDLRERGIAVWNVDYRGVDRPGGGADGTYRDVLLALNVIEGGSPLVERSSRVLLGHSAGGHLALWAAHTETGTDTVISTGGLPDLQAIADSTGHPCGSDGARAMAGSPPRYGDYSPIAMLQNDDVRQVQINASEDRVAPPAYAEAYRAAAAAKGGRVETITIAGEGHVELIAPGTEAWKRTVEVIERALR